MNIQKVILTLHCRALSCRDRENGHKPNVSAARACLWKLSSDVLAFCYVIPLSNEPEVHCEEALPVEIKRHISQRTQTISFTKSRKACIFDFLHKTVKKRPFVLSFACTYIKLYSKSSVFDLLFILSLTLNRPIQGDIYNMYPNRIGHNLSSKPDQFHT